MALVDIDISDIIEQLDDDELVREVQDRGFMVYRSGRELPDASVLRMVAVKGSERELRQVVALLCDSTHLLPPNC